MDAAFVGAALREACLVELEALKPGNVHRYAAGHGMTAADFETSAEIVGAVFAEAGPGVGARILAAVERTRAAVGCNTNLGIVLLAAPLAEAALAAGGGDLRQRLGAVLRGLTVADAELAFRAIRLAAPAGLGEASEHDVREPARVALRGAMAAAAERDRIARQYVSGFADVFELGLGTLRACQAKGWREPWAAAATYLGFAGRFPDSHIARKLGAAQAEATQRRFVPLMEALQAAERPEALTHELLALDAELKAAGLNPGTSADLTVASLYARRLQDALQHES
ncbi:MAG: triphosphoribosyl-dephospho-CoA synthase [Kiloniellales bacterium]